MSAATPYFAAICARQRLQKTRTQFCEDLKHTDEVSGSHAASTFENAEEKPVPIRMLNPKFEENYVKGRDYDPDRERAEKKKLKKRIKEEAKGAASMHLNQGNWERAGREEDEISFWLLLENRIFKSFPVFCKGMEDAECWKYRGLIERKQSRVLLQHALLSFFSNCSNACTW
ncbi:hypothetical protein HAX54_010667 [Datura stramonium]|uniref:Uncharacterized protein n=1 Tax=Datura stramonium TaxID=4076 RepID=A0ABS8X068_DATST|nr:hypothetical protein [Datura stramonium]